MKTKVQQRREELGLSQAQLASRAGVSQASISKYELGLSKSPRLRNCVRIAEALNASVFDLYL